MYVRVCVCVFACAYLCECESVSVYVYESTYAIVPATASEQVVVRLRPRNLEVGK